MFVSRYLSLFYSSQIKLIRYKVDTFLSTNLYALY